jgi:hypothetical protein
MGADCWENVRPNAAGNAGESLLLSLTNDHFEIPKYVSKLFRYVYQAITWRDGLMYDQAAPAHLRAEILCIQNCGFFLHKLGQTLAQSMRFQHQPPLCLLCRSFPALNSVFRAFPTAVTV